MNASQEPRPDNVVPLPVDPPPVPAPAPPTPPRAWHALAISGMALSALVGVASLLAFVTVSWPPATRQTVVTIFAVSVAAFMLCAAVAVFSAVREPTDGEEPQG